MPAAEALRRSYPSGAVIDRWRAGDGLELRRFDWPAEGERGSILFQGGRGDVLEKYLETLHHWHGQGWRITSFDWRWQGGSGRGTREPHVGHIDDFAHYISDLKSLWAEWSVTAQGPRVAIGHSMGGHLLLRGLAEGALDPTAAVLVAPMLGLHSPVGARFGERLARIMAAFGDKSRAAWKGNERPYTTTSRNALLTHDKDRYSDELWWQAQDAALRTGPPSWNWVIEAFVSTRALAASPTLAEIRTPILMLVAEADKLVDPKAALGVASRLPDARVVRFGAESAHEILREVDAVRDRALDEIDVFLDARAPAAI